MKSNILRTNWLWLLLGTVLTVTGIASRPPIPIDETRYLSVAWEMWQNNQFLVPQSNGLPYSHKPPLLFWLIQLSWWVFGVNEWSARLISPLFGLASLFLTKQIAAMLWPSSRESSQTAPWILLGMSIWSIFSTLTMFDMLVVFFSLTAYLIVLTEAKKPNPYSWPLLGLGIGLGLLAKGPVVLVYIAPPILLGPLWVAQTDTHWWQWYGGFITALVIGSILALTWAIPASLAGGQEYGRAILFGQTAGRMAQSFAHQRPFYWYLLLLPLALFPWSLWLPFWRGWKISWDQSLRFCFCALLPAFVILSLISGKQIHYVLPLLPIVAIILSRIAASSPVQKPDDVWLYFIFFALFAVLLFALPILPAMGRDGVLLKFIPQSSGTVPLVTGIVVLWLCLRRNSELRLVIISVSTVLHLIFLQVFISPSVNTLFNPGEAIKALSLAQKERRDIAVYPKNLADQFQFAARLTTPVVVLNTLSSLQVWSSSNPHGYCLILVDRKSLPMFGNAKDAIPYKDGWLLSRTALQLGMVEQSSPTI
ncbi:MAG: glycosyltransferase family 39 protein [Pseudomonadota bacterium]